MTHFGGERFVLGRMERPRYPQRDPRFHSPTQPGRARRKGVMPNASAKSRSDFALDPGPWTLHCETH